MPLTKTLRIFLFLFPISVSAQSVEENLQYINTVFSQFNTFDTSFEVDEVEKKLICHDKFGTYSASFEAVEIRPDAANTSIGIFCIDRSSNCISSTLKDGSESAGFPKYIMDLSQNGELIAGANAVVNKFLLIKKAILGADFTDSVSKTGQLKYNVEIEIQKVNTIFDDHSEYQSNWYFDWDNYWLISASDSCRIAIPLEQISIENYERKNVQNFRHGLVFNSDNSTILETCSDKVNKVSHIDFYFDNQTNALIANDGFITIQKLVTGGDEPLSSTKNIESQLNYINNQFNKYNSYNTHFFIDIDNNELVWIQQFGESRAPLDQIGFKADYEKGWLLIVCKEGVSRCITSTSPNGKIIQHDEYSMALKENNEVIPNIDEIVEAFQELVQKVTN